MEAVGHLDGIAVKLEQHHIRYSEIHGEDEIIILSHEEHKKVHAQDRANGFPPVPEWIVDTAHYRSPVGRAAKKRYRQTEKGKATEAAYALTEASIIAKATDNVSEAGRARKRAYKKTEKGKAAEARYLLKKRQNKEEVI